MKPHSIKAIRRSLAIGMAGALIFTSALPAQEAADPAERVPALTLPLLVKDLEEEARKLATELSANNMKTGQENAAATFDKDKATSLTEISQCLIKRGSILRYRSKPSDDYYGAIQRQLHADMDLETLKVWWKHCRNGSAYESTARFEQIPLAAELVAAKNQADKSVADHKPVTDTPDPENPGIKPLDSSISTRLKGGKGILDQINGWTNLSEETKSKIIAR